jgi:zinc transport system ATP-binding protein
MNFLEVKNLGLKKQEAEILEGLDFCVPDASFLCILGPNGAGKSMFVKILLGLVKPTSGSVLLWNKDPAEIPSSWIGYVPQIKTFDRSFPGLSIELVANGILGNWPTRVRGNLRLQAMEALKLVGAETLAEKSLHLLSGGELQRIFLARAFTQNRRVLILDEPATGIDALGEADLYGLLEKYSARTQCNIVMITHDVEVAKHHATHVLLLNRTQIEFSSKERGLSAGSLQRAFGHSQHKH